MEGLYLDDRIGNESVELEPGRRYSARAIAADPEGDPLTWRWVLRQESDATQVGGDPEEAPDVIPGRLDSGDEGLAILTAPEQPGAYRLFVYVYDGNGNAGHANIPFLVQ